MADRYWVGGSGNWSDNTNHWSATSGGAPGASKPTTSDNVFFDASSHSADYTVTVDESSSCLSISLNKPASGTFTFAGGFPLAANGNWVVLSATNIANTFSGGLTLASGGAQSITSNGLAFATNITQNSAGTSITLLDDLVLTGRTYTRTRGDLNANGFNVTVSAFTNNSLQVGTVTMGGGTWTLTGTGTVWNHNASSSTLVQGTSTIRITDISASSKTFTGGGRIYNNLQIATGGSGAVIFVNDNTFNTIQVTGGGTAILNFTAGSTTTLTGGGASFPSGAPGSLITCQSTSGGTAWNLSKAGGNLVCNYLSLQDSAAAGGAVFYAGSSSTSVSGNSGWLFRGPPPQASSSAGSLIGRSRYMKGSLIG